MNNRIDNIKTRLNNIKQRRNEGQNISNLLRNLRMRIPAAPEIPPGLPFDPNNVEMLMREMNLRNEIIKLRKEVNNLNSKFNAQDLQKMKGMYVSYEVPSFFTTRKRNRYGNPLEIKQINKIGRIIHVSNRNQTVEIQNDYSTQIVPFKSVKGIFELPKLLRKRESGMKM